MHASLLATSAGRLVSISSVTRNPRLKVSCKFLCRFHLHWSYPRTYSTNEFFWTKKFTNREWDFESLEPSPGSQSNNGTNPHCSHWTNGQRPWKLLWQWQWQSQILTIRIGRPWGIHVMTPTWCVKFVNHSSWVDFLAQKTWEFLFIGLSKLLAIYHPASDSLTGIDRYPPMPCSGGVASLLLASRKVTNRDFKLSSLSNGHPWPAGLLSRLEWLAGRKWRPQKKRGAIAPNNL